METAIRIVRRFNLHKDFSGTTKQLAIPSLEWTKPAKGESSWTLLSKEDSSIRVAIASKEWDRQDQAYRISAAVEQAA
jgi:hypothetical protein